MSVMMMSVMAMSAITGARTRAITRARAGAR